MSISAKLVFSVVISFAVMSTASAQRPPFAGSRPPNGLNQKDKYNANVAPASPEVQNRFGDSDAAPVISNQIPHGQPQRPPVGLVVTPVSVYTPLSPNRPTSAANTGGVVFEDRFGDTGTNVISSAGVSTAAAPATTSSPARPLDAHGDQQLIDKLSKLPPDQQPFWFVNYKAIEAQRNSSTSNIAGSQASRGSFFG